MTLEFKQAGKRVGGDVHISPTDITLQGGGFNVLLGTTLSGKTTMLRLMAGLEVPTQGEVWFDGSNVTGVPVQKRSVSMVYQQFINYPSFTVFENIASPLKVARLASGEIKNRVNNIAELLKLTPMLDRLPSELSGGQQQRTALARALVKNSKLVLLDEPLANLDYKLREELRDELPKLFAQSGTTVVYATTEPLEALMLGGHTATLFEGQVVQYGATANIYRLPNNLTSASVFSDPPINTATVKKQGKRFVLNDSTCWSVPGRYSNLADTEYTVAIRPHHLTLLNSHNKPDEENEFVNVNGTVMVSEISGSESIVRVNVDGNQWVSESRGVHPYEVGDSAQFRLHVNRCLYFDQDQNLIN